MSEERGPILPYLPAQSQVVTHRNPRFPPSHRQRQPSPTGVAAHIHHDTSSDVSTSSGSSTSKDAQLWGSDDQHTIEDLQVEDIDQINPQERMGPPLVLAAPRAPAPQVGVHSIQTSLPPPPRVPMQNAQGWQPQQLPPPHLSQPSIYGPTQNIQGPQYFNQRPHSQWQQPTHQPQINGPGQMGVRTEGTLNLAPNFVSHLPYNPPPVVLGERASDPTQGMGMSTPMVFDTVNFDFSNLGGAMSSTGPQMDFERDFGVWFNGGDGLQVESLDLA